MFKLQDSQYKCQRSKQIYLLAYILCHLACITQISNAADKDVLRYLMENGYYTEAIEYLKKGLATDDNNVLLNYNIGVCYLRKKYLSIANYYFDKTLSLSPELGEKIGEEYIYAASSAVITSDFQYINSVIEIGLKHNSSSQIKRMAASIYENKGNGELRKGNHDGATECFMKSREVNPSQRLQYAESFFIGEGIRSMADWEMSKAEMFFDNAINIGWYHDSLIAVYTAIFNKTADMVGEQKISAVKLSEKYFQKMQGLFRSRRGGRILHVIVEPDEVRDIESVKASQKWSYYYISDHIEQRVLDNGGNDWLLIMSARTPFPYFTSDKKGVLQLKAKRRSTSVIMEFYE